MKGIANRNLKEFKEALVTGMPSPLIRLLFFSLSVFVDILIPDGQTSQFNSRRFKA